MVSQNIPFSYLIISKDQTYIQPERVYKILLQEFCSIAREVDTHSKLLDKRRLESYSNGAIESLVGVPYARKVFASPRTCSTIFAALAKRMCVIGNEILRQSTVMSVIEWSLEPYCKELLIEHHSKHCAPLVISSSIPTVAQREPCHPTRVTQF